jgi:hypothetical protein
VSATISGIRASTRSSEEMTAKVLAATSWTVARPKVAWLATITKLKWTANGRWFPMTRSTTWPHPMVVLTSALQDRWRRTRAFYTALFYLPTADGGRTQFRTTTSLLNALKTLRADIRMVEPFRAVMKNGHAAFFVLAAIHLRRRFSLMWSSEAAGTAVRLRRAHSPLGLQSPADSCRCLANVTSVYAAMRRGVGNRERSRRALPALYVFIVNRTYPT